MYCSKCGKQIDDDSVFCGFCGNKVVVMKKVDSVENKAEAKFESKKEESKAKTNEVKSSVSVEKETKTIEKPKIEAKKDQESSKKKVVDKSNYIIEEKVKRYPAKIMSIVSGVIATILILACLIIFMILNLVKTGVIVTVSRTVETYYEQLSTMESEEIEKLESSFNVDEYDTFEDWKDGYLEEYANDATRKIEGYIPVSYVLLGIIGLVFLIIYILSKVIYLTGQVHHRKIINKITIVEWVIVIAFAVCSTITYSSSTTYSFYCALSAIIGGIIALHLIIASILFADYKKVELYCPKCGKRLIHGLTNNCPGCHNKLRCEEMDDPEKVTVMKTKELRRPWMKALYRIAGILSFDLILVFMICSGILLADYEYALVRAKTVSDEKWEDYENFIEDDGEKISEENIQSIKKDIKKYGYSKGMYNKYYGYGSYTEWKNKALKEIIEDESDEIEDVIDYKLVGLAGIGVFVIYYVAKKSYKERTKLLGGVRIWSKY